MRNVISIAMTVLVLTSHAQIELNRPLQFTSTTSGERQVIGLAYPEGESHLSSLESVKSGFVHWCGITRNVDTLILTPQLPVSARNNGQMLRFSMDIDSPGDTWITVGGLPSKQLLDGDGNVISKSTLRESELVQVQWQDSVYYLMSPPSNSCPSGFLKVTDALCI